MKYPHTHTDRALEADIDAFDRVLRVIKKSFYCPVKATQGNWQLPQALRDLVVTWLGGLRDKLRKERKERKIKLRRQAREKAEKLGKPAKKKIPPKDRQAWDEIDGSQR